LPKWRQILGTLKLRCAELEKDITADEVGAILVAWEIPERVKEVCDRYGIKYFQNTI